MKGILNINSDIEDKFLAPFAARSTTSRGRVYIEEQHPYRTAFQRDRDRIIHSRAFRRLEYKTQVFVNHEGDHYRTRLTHTLEVAQIARTIARVLRLNEDLSEAIALAHDLGHTPFGHAGEKELNELLKDEHGFKHNRQSLRVIENLEQRYSGFSGLNLTWETREGIVKHSSYHDHPEISSFSPDEFASLEAQIIDLADEIAYNNHDLDDGISSGLLQLDDVKKLSIWELAIESLGGAKKLSPNKKLLINQIIKTIINLLVTDLIQTTLEKIEEFSIKDYFDVRKAPTKVVSFSNEIERMNYELMEFLNKNLYQHYRVVRMSIKAQKVIRELFTLYLDFPNALPHDYYIRIENDGLKQTISDYIAGMTDRYALEEHQRLTDPMIKV
ncbi:MAG: deoxyguanosinetriphosphate triphosphohydrolase [Spirochaetota bacterium]|nr:deoxyguanosinetriphosphate triphosphohydrolase [Spirochaetota bacterium]